MFVSRFYCICMGCPAECQCTLCAAVDKVLASHYLSPPIRQALDAHCVLFFRIMRFPWQMSKAKVQQILTEALKVWSDVTPLTFTEISEGRADIIIDFTR